MKTISDLIIMKPKLFASIVFTAPPTVITCKITEYRSHYSMVNFW